jgi:hypothetical protein
MSDFKKVWWNFNLPHTEDRQGTYREYAYDALPPAPTEKFDGSLTWMYDLLTEDDEMQDEPDDDYGNQSEDELQANLAKLISQAEAHGLSLPKSFLGVMSDRKLRLSIISPTACNFQLYELVQLRDREKEYVISFYWDSQACLVWHLHLDSHGNEKVLVCHNFAFNAYQYDETPVREVYGEDSDDYLDQIRAGSTALFEECAPSFEEFIWRVNIECAVWFGGTSSDAIAYTNHYKKITTQN